MRDICKTIFDWTIPINDLINVKKLSKGLARKNYRFKCKLPRKKSLPTHTIPYIINNTTIHQS